MGANAQTIQSIWNEAKQRALTLHGEGLLTAWDIARNDSRIAGDANARRKIREMYEAEVSLDRIAPKGSPAARSDSTDGLSHIGSFVLKAFGPG